MAKQPPIPDESIPTLERAKFREEDGDPSKVVVAVGNDDGSEINSILPPNAATATNQVDGSQQTNIRGNTDGTLIGNEGDRLNTAASIVEIQANPKTISLLSAAQSAGLLNGEYYDSVLFEESGGIGFLSYSLSGIEQFILTINILSGGNSWRITKTEPFGYLLQENGDKVLQETGDPILVQGLIPV